MTISRRMAAAARVALAALILLLAALPARADWVNLTGAEVAPNIAEIYIEDDGVRVELEVFVGDLKEFIELIPDTLLTEQQRAVAPSAAERLAGFAQNGLTIQPDGSAPLHVEVRLAEPRMRTDRRSPFAGQIDPISGRKLPEPPADPRVLFVELFYPFDAGPPPDRLTLSPPRDENGAARAAIGMLVFHRDVPVIDFRFLSDSAEIDLDWDDPWFSAFENPNLRRHHSYPQMSFLYAEPFEIRHEALIRVRDAMAMTGMTASGPVLTAAEAEDLMRRVAEFVAERSPMTIDGAAASPDFDRGSYLNIGLRGLAILGPDEPISVDAAILGLIWSAPTDGYPKEAAVTWTLFDDERAPVVQGYSIDAAGPFLSPLTRDDPVLAWTNHFKKSTIPVVEEISGGEWSKMKAPALSIGLGLAALGGLAGALRTRGGRRGIFLAVGLLSLVGGYLTLPYGQVTVSRPAVAKIAMSEEQAAELTERLLANVYRSFEFKGEGQVYDRLAKTLDGAVLEDVYLDQRRSLRVAGAGGAEARVTDVSVESAVPTPLPDGASTFSIRTNWLINGRVGHWGHVHTRVNAYEADLTISAESGAWKIIGFEVLSQDRLS